MNEKELGEALLRYGPEADAKQVTQRIIDRDTVRVRILLWFTVLVWLFAAGLVLIGMVQYALVFPEQAKFQKELESAAQERGGLQTAAVMAAQTTILVSFQKATLLITFAVAKMCFAALCTVALVLFSRRATLRQVNAGLMEVTAELRRLRPAT